MRKRLTRAGAFLLALALTMTAALAADAQRFLRGFEIEEQHMEVLCADLPEGEFKTTLDGKEVPAVRSDVETADLAVTVYALVDVSGSMNNAQMQQVRDALQAISDAMGEGDNLLISSLGNSAVSSGLMNTKEERDAAIAALVQGHEDTNLYAGIVDSLKALDTDTSFNRVRCLVILSDGDDQQATGITEQEVTAAVQGSRVPVYTVATMRQSPSAKQKEFAKHLGSFARLSVGGIHYAPVVDGTSAADAGAGIWSDLMGGTVLDIDLGGAEIDRSKNEVILRVTYTSGDTKQEDALTLYTEDLPAPPAPPEPEGCGCPDCPNCEDCANCPDPSQCPDCPVCNPPAPPVVEGCGCPDCPNCEDCADCPDPSQCEGCPVCDPAEPEPEPEPEPESGFPWLYVIIAGVLVVILAVVIILVVVNKKKKARLAAEEERKRQEAQAAELARQQAEARLRAEEEARRRAAQEAAARAAQPKPRPGCVVTLTGILHPEVVCRIELPDRTTVTVGRDKNRCAGLLDVRDPKLSGAHFDLMRDGRRTFVRDDKSTNGTSVNGVPIKGRGWMPVENGCIIHAGTFDYRARFDFD